MITWKKSASTSANTLDSSSSTSTTSTDDSVNNKRIKKVAAHMANSSLTDFINNFMDTITGRNKGGGSYEPVSNIDKYKGHPLVKTVEYSQPNSPIEMSDMSYVKGKAPSTEDTTPPNFKSTSYRRKFQDAINSGSFFPESQAENRAFLDYLEARSNIDTPMNTPTDTNPIITKAEHNDKSSDSTVTPTIVTHNLDTPPDSPTASNSSKEDNNTGTPLNSPVSEQAVGEDVAGIRQHKNPFSALDTDDNSSTEDNSEYDSDKTPTQSTVLEKPKEF